MPPTAHHQAAYAHALVPKPFILFACVALINACAPSARLTPANGPGPAIAGSSGVTLSILADAWWGSQRIFDEVTPLLITVRNASGHDVELRYSDFYLIDDHGHRHAALPLLRPTSGRTLPVDEERLGLRYVFPHSGFYIAPYLARYFPRVPIAAWDFAFDDAYYKRYFGHSRSPEMLELALPEGVLAENGEIGGFVFFEHVDAHSGRVFADFDVVAAGENQPFDRVRLTFNAEALPSGGRQRVLGLE